MNALLQGVALVTLRKRRQAVALQSASRRGRQAARNSDLRLLTSEPIRVISVIRGLLRLNFSLLDEFRAACERSMFEMSVEYTDAPPTRPESTAADQMPCPYCGHLLPKDAQSCDRCDWKRGATETAEGKASDAVAVILSIIPGLGHIYKGHKLAGFLWMAGAIPVGIFVLLAAVASAGFGIGLFFFYLIAVMLHAYAVDDRVVTPKEDEGEEY
jgi:hypothetical protein